jgi:hypothetical protein
MGQANLSLIPNNLFDYAALDRDTEVAARSDAALIKGLMRRTAEDVIEIGNALIRQQKKLPRGMFLPWIETEFDMSQAAAYRFIHVAKKFDGKVISLINLNLEAIYELAAPSTPPEVQAEVERRVAAGELVNADDVRTLREQFNEIAAKAVDLAKETDFVREQNRDLLANAHRIAAQEAEQKYGAEIDDLKRRAALAEETAAASMRLSEAEANPQTITDPANVVSFVPKDDGEQVVEADPLGDDGVDDVDITDMRVGAHAIYGSISTIDFADTTPEIFWSLFGTKNGKAGTVKWLNSTLRKLNAIKKGMPK